MQRGMRPSKEWSLVREAGKLNRGDIKPQDFRDAETAHRGSDEEFKTWAQTNRENAAAKLDRNRGSKAVDTAEAAAQKPGSAVEKLSETPEDALIRKQEEGDGTAEEFGRAHQVEPP